MPECLEQAVRAAVAAAAVIAHDLSIWPEHKWRGCHFSACAGGGADWEGGGGLL